jgi:hypothetical protein
VVIVATICGIPSIGWMRRDILRMQGDLRIADGELETLRRKVTYTASHRSSLVKELAEAESWIKRHRKRRKKAK